MTWHMEVLKIYLEEIQNMMNIKEFQLQFVIHFLKKKKKDFCSDVKKRKCVKPLFMLCEHQLKNYTNRLLRNVYSSFIDNIWAAYLADMQLLSKFNKIIHFLLYVIDIYSKYACLVPLKDKKGIGITSASQKNIR